MPSCTQAEFFAYLVAGSKKAVPLHEKLVSAQHDLRVIARRKKLVSNGNPIGKISRLAVGVETVPKQ
jgi:hypothetical protein